jgi:chaperonin GroES
MTKIKPLYDRIIVKPNEMEEKTSAGIIIPDKTKEKPQEGIVMAVGDGNIKSDGNISPLQVKEGDKVMYAKWTGNEVKIDGEELLIMKESDILGIIN